MTEDSSTDWRTVVARPIDRDFFQPLSAAAALEVAAASTCGPLRPVNTDHYLALRIGRTQETLLSSLSVQDLPAPFSESAYALLVADGLGNRGAGARASRVVLSAMAHLAIRHGRWNVRVDPENVHEITEQSQMLWQRAHEALVRAARGDRKLSDMAASVTGVYIAGADLFFAHVGHAKAFLFRDGTLIPLTSDHTRNAQRSDDSQEITTDFAHEIVRLLGRRGDPGVDVEHVKLADADRVLLCTNGLTDAVNPNDIANTLALQRRPADDCQRLIELAAAARAADDVTVVVADYRLRA